MLIIGYLAYPTIQKIREIKPANGAEIIFFENIISVQDKFGLTIEKQVDGSVVTYRYYDGIATSTFIGLFKESELNNAKLMAEWEANHDGISLIDWYGVKMVRQRYPLIQENEIEFKQQIDIWNEFIYPTPPPQPTSTEEDTL